MDLKNKVLELLEEKKFSYSDLASYLGITEATLDHALDTETLEVRTLELISKALRIPLYSFFRDPVKMEKQLNANETAYYDAKIWEDTNFQFRSENEKLRQELQDCKKEIEKRDQIIDALESQLKKGG